MLRDTPFHPGELEVQARMEVREKVHGYASRFIRDRLPQEHREFYAGMPMLFVGSVSAAGTPTASVLFGRPGFLSTPDDRTLAVAALPVVGDPLEERVRVGAALGMLGIDFETRRRNRVNGRVQYVRDGRGGFALRVGQAFGNCPQHIRPRSLTLDERVDAARITPRTRQTADHLDERARAIVHRAGAFFIASAHLEDAGDERHGVDVSHRGGAPGFLRVEDERTLLFPDFRGNRHYNTIGNLVRSPAAGLLVVDFEAGDLLQIEGRAEVIWGGALVDAFDGAERFVRIHVDDVRCLVGAVPLTFGPARASSNERLVGSWARARESLATRSVTPGAPTRS